MRTLITERLILTPWTDNWEDAAGLYAYAKDPDVGPRAGWKPHESVEESLQIIREIFMPNLVWAIREKPAGRMTGSADAVANAAPETGLIVGSIGLEDDRRREGVNSKEMGYSLAKERWGRGYMPEAARAVMDYGFSELGLVVMGICTGPENSRSQRVIEKCGFKYEGRQRRGYHILDGTDRDNLVFSILREEWEELRRARKTGGRR